MAMENQLLHWHTKAQCKQENPEKLATYGTQDEEKQNNNTTQCV
jgi:hypothetical protein